MNVTYQSVKIRLLDDDSCENLHLFTSSQNFSIHAWRALREKNLNKGQHNLANWIIFATWLNLDISVRINLRRRR